MQTQSDPVLRRAEDDLPLDNVLVIDCHGHIGESVRCWMPFRDAQGILTTMDRVGVDIFCMSAFRSLRGDYEAGNDEVIAVTEAYPDRFLGYAVAQPRHPDNIAHELERCFEHDGIRGIKIHPTTYVHSYPINGPNYEPVWEFAKRHNCPVLTHAGPRSERHTCGPDLIADVARRHPRVNLIIGHAGSYDSWQALDEHIEVVKQHDNLFLDISTMNRFYRSIDYMVGKVGSERVLFGSDATLHAIIPELGAVIYARISDRAKENVLGLNMARLLKLEFN